MLIIVHTKDVNFLRIRMKQQNDMWWMGMGEWKNIVQTTANNGRDPPLST